jgi:hypothetical protein
MPVADFLTRLQSTQVAATIGGSTTLTGLLSGIHLLGLTLVVGSAAVSGLRMLGVILKDRPVSDVTPWPGRGMLIGVSISIVSGLLLFSPRASAAAVNGFFQLKMLLLGTALAFHFGVFRRVNRRTDARPSTTKLAGGLGFLLWFSVAVAGCAFILLE